MARLPAFALVVALSACGDDASSGSAADSPATSACTELTAAFVACGGDPTGSWVAQQGCLSISLEQLASDQCPERIPAELTPTGTVTFAAGAETNDVSGELTAAVSLEDACLDSLSHGLLPAVQVCAQIQSQAEAEGFTGFCVHSVACFCSLHGSVAAPGSRRYEVDAGRLIDPDDPARQVEFCVEGTTLTLREVDPSGSPTLLVLGSQAP